MEKRRGGECIAMFGHNNTGKSVLCRKFIEMFNSYRDSDKRDLPKSFNNLITFDVQNRFHDLKRDGDVNILSSNEDWCKPILKMRNSLVIIDDYKVLMPTDRTPTDFLDLLQFRSEYGIDIIIITHNPSLLLERLTYYVNRYILFYTTGKPESFKSKIADYEALTECKKVIDEHRRKFTQEEYGAFYPNFPFIEYNSETQKAIKYNF